MTKKQECLDFIRYVLNPEKEAQKDWSALDWEELFRFASEQAILGVVFEGVKRLGERGVKPPFQVLMKWVAMTEQIERRNRMVNKVAVKLTAQLKEDGFECCILKGQGNNLLYPNVYARTPGDIDVWVRRDGRCEREEGRRMKEDVKRTIRYVKQHNPKGKAVYHHADYGVFEGVEVEVHYRPAFLCNPMHNARLQRWFEEEAQEQFGHQVELPDHVGQVSVPITEFNIIYQLTHIYNHLLHEGIGLRQVMDYYYVLMSEESWKRDDVSDTLHHLGLWKIAGAMMWVLHEVLGLDDKCLIAPMNERLGRVLLSEIIRGGNFGQYDEENIRANSPLKKNWQRIKRDVRMMRYFPSECLWEPAFRLYHFFWRVNYR